VADDTLKDLDLPAEEKRKFCVNCKKFYITTIDHFQVRFDFDDLVFQFCHLALSENPRKDDPKLF
jgi:RNase P subunit RPR2